MGHHYGYVRALDLKNNKNAFGWSLFEGFHIPTHSKNSVAISDHVTINYYRPAHDFRGQNTTTKSGVVRWIIDYGVVENDPVFPIDTPTRKCWKVKNSEKIVFARMVNQYHYMSNFGLNTRRKQMNTTAYVGTWTLIGFNLLNLTLPLFILPANILLAIQLGL